MKFPWKERPPSTARQLAEEEMLTQIYALPVGKSGTYRDLAHDGFGGMSVKRHDRHTFVFQRTGYIGRSRWADTPGQAREEIAHYLRTGRLKEPDKGEGMVKDHECRECLIYRDYEWTEPHGERCWQEWWQCVECDREFTARELDEWDV